MKFNLTPVRTFAKDRLSDVWDIVDDALIKNDDGRVIGRRGMLFGNYFGGVASTLIAGIYFTGLMLYMGASEMYIGYITMVTSICTFLQLLAPLVMERLKQRKPILMAFRFLVHFLNIIFIGIVPLLPLPQTARLVIFMSTVVVINLINSFSGSAINVWHMQSIPLRKRANYFTLAGLGSTIIATLTAFCAGLAVDSIEEAGFSLFGLSPEYFAFLLLRLIALLAAGCELKFHLQIPEYPYEDSFETKKVGLGTLLLPLRNRGFMMMAFVTFTWNILSGFLGPYFNVYLLEKAHMSYSYVSLAGVISLPLTIIFTPIWARIINRRGWFKMLVLALIGYSVTFLLNACVTEETQVLFIISYMICFIFNPCVSLNWSNIQFMQMPPTNQTAFCSFYSAFVALGTIIGNFLGTQFFRLTEGMSFTFFGMTITNYQWMPLMQFAITMGLIVYIATVRHILRRDPANSSLNL